MGFTVAHVCLLLAAVSTVAAGPMTSGSRYSGFSDLKTIFSFGDSYTRTGFDYTSTLPSYSSPFGNSGTTSSNGPNWIQYLTTKHNASLLLTYNFAIGGATVDDDLVSGSTDVVTQIEEQFIPTFGSSELWQPATTLFAVWIGINDVENSYLLHDTTTIFPKIMAKYADLLELLYDTGARNFLLLNVPSLERAPRTTQSSAAATRIPQKQAAVALYNTLLLDLVGDLKGTYSDAKVWHLDTYKYFDLVQTKPKAFIETSRYRNTNTYCDAYTRGTETSDYKDEECEWAADEYLWLNSLHPTSPIHELLSYKASKLL